MITWSEALIGGPVITIALLIFYYLLFGTIFLLTDILPELWRNRKKKQLETA